MLFSRSDISAFINRSFEPAWQSLRPAAVVRVDFGNGNVVTRTLNGNIATYVSTADGTVLDVIPGVYDPETYLQRLHQATLLHQWATKRPRELPQFVKNYHAEQAAAIRRHNEPKVIVRTRDNPASIVRIESGLKLALRSSLRGTLSGEGLADRRPFSRRTASSHSGYDLPAELASRMGRLTPAMLTKDSRYNETVRRLKIHDYLAENSPVKPSGMTRWLYRNVLDTDLDDPYLGLGKVLFSSYPFRDDDQRP